MSLWNRSFFAVAIAVGLAVTGLPTTSSASHFSKAELKCRSTIGKSGGKYVKSALKAMTGCHKNRDKNGGSTNCNDISAADGDGKVTAAAGKFSTKVSDTCENINPSDVNFLECPAPCAGVLATMTGVATCLTCLADANTEAYSDEANGFPPSPPLAGEDAACHGTITKSGSKFFNSAMKSAAKCQASRDTMDDFTQCSVLQFDVLVQDAYDKCVASITDKCADTTLPGTTLDPCGGSASAGALATCVCGEARSQSQALAQQFTQLVVVTPTTTISTTTTTLPPSDPTCPDVGELTLYSRDSQQECDEDLDCPEPRFCDETVGICRTVATLDSGWKGSAHGSDINDQVTTRAHLFCPDNDPGLGCGECDVLGIDPEARNCRCANNTRTICDTPFDQTSPDCPTCAGGVAVAGRSCAANTDCNFPTCEGRCSGNLSFTCANNNDCKPPIRPSNAGTCSLPANRKCTNGLFCTANADCQGTCTAQSACDCYFGSPFPLVSGGVAACVVNRFAENISGTANPDLGAGEITANLRTRVYLGITNEKPCPVCAGKCTTGGATCTFDTDCGVNGPCVQDVPNDGNRNGVCSGGANTNQPCDAGGFNASFPARTNAGTPVLPGGAQYSIDCLPSVGINVSGVGLEINLVQTTGAVPDLNATLDCNADQPGTNLCPCMQCSKVNSKPCSSDAQCASQGSFCNGYTDPTVFECNSNAECDAVDTGICSAGECTNATAKSCSSNAECGLQNAGDCVPSTCSSPGNFASYPQPNACASLSCVATIDDPTRGKCEFGPDELFCDGLLRIDGTGVNSCATNGDCTAFANYGACTLSKTRQCYLDPIVASGNPDPYYPVAASTFCIPPTESAGINTAAGLPGAGRVISQGGATTYCSTDHNTPYTPGGFPACPPPGP